MTTVIGTFVKHDRLTNKSGTFFRFGQGGRILQGDLTALPPSLVPKAGRPLEGTLGDIGEHQRDPGDQHWHPQPQLQDDLHHAALGREAKPSYPDYSY